MEMIQKINKSNQILKINKKDVNLCNKWIERELIKTYKKKELFKKG